ncbi:MAG: hypothetical protein R3B95_15705 [Nitrospirales bacterium]
MFGKEDMLDATSGNGQPGLMLIFGKSSQAFFSSVIYLLENYN